MSTTSVQDLSARMKTSLSAPVDRADPAFGSSEQDESVTATTYATTSEPVVFGRDLTGGIMAAGAAMLSAVVIILLVAIIANSKHHEE